MVKKVWATMGKNMAISKAIATGGSYFRWTATGASLGAVKGATDNLLGIGQERKMPFMTSVKYGAMMGAGGRAMKGLGTGMANRRRLRGRGA